MHPRGHIFGLGVLIVVCGCLDGEPLDGLSDDDVEICDCVTVHVVEAGVVSCDVQRPGTTEWYSYISTGVEVSETTFLLVDDAAPPVVWRSPAMVVVDTCEGIFAEPTPTAAPEVAVVNNEILVLETSIPAAILAVS